MRIVVLCSLLVVVSAGCSRLGSRSLAGEPGADSRSISCALSETRRLGYSAAGVQPGTQAFVAEKAIFRADAGSYRSLAQLSVALVQRADQWHLQVDPNRYSLDEPRQGPTTGAVPGDFIGRRPPMLGDSTSQPAQRNRGRKRLPLGPVLGDAQRVLQVCGGR